MTSLPPGFTYLADYRPQREATLIDGLLSTDLTVVSAQTKVGKSWLAGFVAKSVSTGTDFLGQSVVETPGRVVFIGGDGGWRDELHERWARDAWTRNGLVVPDFGLADYREDPYAFGERIRPVSPALIIVDHLNHLAGSLELNDRGPAMEAMIRLACLRGIAPVLLLAHAGHGGVRAAGSFALRAEPRILWELSPRAPGPEGPRMGIKVIGNRVMERSGEVTVDCNGLTCGVDWDRDARAHIRGAVDLSPLLALSVEVRRGTASDIAKAWAEVDPERRKPGTLRNKVRDFMTADLLALDPDGVLVAGAEYRPFS